MNNTDFEWKDIAQSLLSERGIDGKIPIHPYHKWTGTHWVLYQLADIGYPPGDLTLLPLRSQLYEWLLSDHYQKGKSISQELTKRCASQIGGTVYSLTKLGLEDETTIMLTEELIRWQKPDGSWYCDKNPTTSHNVFVESLISLRALTLFGQKHNNQDAINAAKRASEIFLKRQLFLGEHNEKIIDKDFISLHYPCYWHYDILFALKVMKESGYLEDPRCQKALKILKSKQLSDGSFPADICYYEVIQPGKQGRKSGSSLVDWGGKHLTIGNPWVTRDAYYVMSF